MKRLLMAVAVLALSASLASAVTVTCDAPPNPGVPVSVVGLTVLCGGLTFDNFAVQNGFGVPSPLVSLVSATFSGGVALLNFNPNLVVTAGNVQDVQLFFRVTGGINQIDLSVGGSRASVNEHVCATDSSPSGVCGGSGDLANLTVLSNTGNQPIWSSPFASTSPVYIFKDIGLDGRTSDAFGPAADAALSNFTQSFHTVPEPLSFLLIGSGLMALAGFRKFSRQ